MADNNEVEGGEQHEDHGDHVAAEVEKVCLMCGAPMPEEDGSADLRSTMLINVEGTGAATREVAIEGAGVVRVIGLT